jgi:signal transduction histidine kinase
MATTKIDSFQASFRPRARILKLLGDQLIASPRLAVFELVKNAYDADADEVHVRLENLGEPDAKISVSDNGEGMTEDIIRQAWLVPADDHKELSRAEGKRTKRKRLPLGEKGLGRFAVHKLGDVVELVTRSKNEPEFFVKIDWRDLTSAKYLDEAKVRVTAREPAVFTGKKTGTRIQISALREQTWSRGEVRRLYRQVMAFCSPFEGPGDFNVLMEVPGFQNWIEDIPDPKELMRTALWRFDFEFDRGQFSWRFRFRGLRSLSLEKREIQRTNDTLLVPADSDGGRRARPEIAGPDVGVGIGPVKGSFRVFDRDKEVLALLPEKGLLQDLLDENGGVRVYRDGVRVHDYGEREDDWLGLDLRRVNTPTRSLSRNIVIGEIRLDLAHSQSLIEKTNREGFVENKAYRNLRRIVLGALTVLEAERKKDKDKIRQQTGTGSSEERGINRHLDQLRDRANKLGVLEKLKPSIDQVETDYREMRDTLLQAGMSGIGLAIVFHEIERGIRTAHDRLEKGGNVDIVMQQLADIRRILDDFSKLLRNEKPYQHNLQDVVRQSIALNRIRFRTHGIKLEGSLVQDTSPKLSATFSRKLILGALTNIIDNAIYWMDVRWPDSSARKRKLWIGTGEDLGEEPAIIIADTGPGLRDDPDDLIRPFFTRRPDGMGLGLYYANMVMELSGGRLIFPERGDLGIPAEFDGAVVGLVFAKS